MVWTTHLTRDGNNGGTVTANKQIPYWMIFARPNRREWSLVRIQ
ncbi:MAG: hypothetical protein R2767_01475 [Chitinophagales bacterium]